VRGAGTAAVVTAREENGFVQLKMPSGEIRKVLGRCRATVGQLGNVEAKNVKWGKAGRKRHLGIRPTVRGVAQHPAAHPHGGGEGRSGVGMASPKTPWGKPALGYKTRRRHHTDRFIIKRRKS
jgi:large subunit ribosomal protein L2